VSLVVLLAGCSTNQTQTAAHNTPYHNPLTSPGAKYGALPPAVQRTVLAQVGPEDIVNVVRDTSSGRVYYKIYFRDADIFPTLYVSPDGSVLNPDLTVALSAARGVRVKAEEVPAIVKKAVQEHAPASEVAYFNLESWGGRVVYVVNFRDETHNPKLLIASDGTIVEEAP
jgi:hypothetical protein